jgi:hypothetical protein
MSLSRASLKLNREVNMIRWLLECAGENEEGKIKTLLLEGWEPFAVSTHAGIADHIYFRKKF